MYNLYSAQVFGLRFASERGRPGTSSPSLDNIYLYTILAQTSIVCELPAFDCLGLSKVVKCDVSRWISLLLVRIQFYHKGH